MTFDKELKKCSIKKIQIVRYFKLKDIAMAFKTFVEQMNLYSPHSKISEL